MRVFPSLHKLFALALLILAPYASAQYFTAPISNLPDPFITYQDGWYYSTGTGPGIQLKKAKTLEELKSVSYKQVFSSANGGPCCDYWAPELHRINNIWYIYYTANNAGSITNQRMYVIENTAADPTTGTWTNKGRVFDSSADVWAIDATVLQLNGTNYLIWSGVANASDGDKPQRLYIGKLTNPWTLQAGRVLLSTPDNAWERNGALVNEGPSVLRRNGKVFLTFSGSGCWTPDYAIGMLYMNETANPMVASSWTKVATPLFTKDPGKDVYGPGHHSFFSSPDGQEVWFAYHATTVAGGACDDSRSVRAQKVSFDASGFPVLGTPLATGIRITAPSGEQAVPVNSKILNGLYRIVPSSSGKSLDVAGCNPALGTIVQQWDSANVDCQKWNLQATADGYFTLTSRRGGLSMDVQGCSTANAAGIQTWAPSGADCQKWGIDSVGNGNYKISSKASGRVLDVQFGTADNGAKLQIYDYLANPQQHFGLQLLESSVRVNPGTYEIVSRKSGLALDLTNCSNDNGAGIQQYTRNHNDCQKWKVEDAGGGYYRIRAFNNNKSIDINGCSTTPGTKLQIWDTYDNDCQKFSFVHVSDNYFSIINKASGLAWDVNGCSTAANATVQQWTNWLGDCQQWKFEAPGAQFSLLREAESFSSMAGVQTETTTDPLGGNQNVGWVDAGDWMAFSNITIPTSGNYRVDYRVASPSSNTALSLDLNAGTIQLGQVIIPNTGGWQNWATVSQTVYMNAGTYSVGIFAVTGGWNINWFKITAL